MTCDDDTVGLVASQIDMLRRTVFPLDPSPRRESLVRLLDPVLEPRQRLQALWNLASVQAGTSTSAESAVRMRIAALNEPEIVRGAIDLAAAGEPEVRAHVWRTMRGVRNVELVQPLIDTLREDTDGEVRARALTVLAADFADDPRVRAVIGTAAREDSHPLVHAFAQRAQSGDEAAWDQYVTTTLKDTSRSGAERIEAFFYHVTTDLGANSNLLQRLLDDEGAAEALAEVLPKAFPPQTGAVSTVTVMSYLGQIDHPAVTGMLLDALDQSTESVARHFVFGELLNRRDDPHVRAALEKISTEDADSQLREMASRALRRSPAPPAAQSPTR